MILYDSTGLRRGYCEPDANRVSDCSELPGISRMLAADHLRAATASASDCHFEQVLSVGGVEEGSANVLLCSLAIGCIQNTGGIVIAQLA